MSSLAMMRVRWESAVLTDTEDGSDLLGRLAFGEEEDAPEQLGTGQGTSVAACVERRAGRGCSRSAWRLGRALVPE